MKIKSTNIEKHYSMLELLFHSLPYVYWKNKEGKYLGANQNQAIGFGFNSPAEFIGKTIYEILDDQPSAASIDAIDQRIMAEDKPLVFAERIMTPFGERFYHSQKSAIHDETGEVIGLLGFAMDITEITQREEEVKKERDRLIKIAAQVAHDIRSPAASVLMLAKSCQAIPEKERIALREAAMRIQDIANNLLCEYKPNDSTRIVAKKTEPILISMLVFQLVAEKRLQYSDLSIQLDCEISSEATFCLIYAKEVEIQRALSNLINNAVEAYESKSGIKIVLKIDADAELVKLTVTDFGKGMSKELIEKLNDEDAVTQGKASGHGIGLLQVKETVRDNHGQFLIESTLGQGTTMTIALPRHPSLPWFADKISLNANDWVIILDDDLSIHGAWDARFDSILQKTPDLTIQHFTDGAELILFINQLSPKDKQRIYLLADYELLNQDLTGLTVIADTQVERAILVTSHYADPMVKSQAITTGTKILPKQLASEIEIEIKYNSIVSEEDQVLDKIDAIIVDDDENYVNVLISFAFQGQTVSQYHDPQSFLAALPNLPRHMKVFLDNNFNGARIKGLDIANRLDELGFTRLYLLSGEVLNDEIPDYLTVINKSDIDRIKNLATI